ncbi:MAG: major facilitator superfamily 1 [Verrucomicrobiales bacterium]|nr:major facilitator superfamily 1 [Verrucomicrobiales bacterium]
MTKVDNTPIAPNAHRLLWAGFMAILAAGVGFALRGGIFDNWGKEYGFTGSQLGAIGGAGFNGFCFGIIIGGVIVDKIGYGKLVVAAFALHILSAVVTCMATPSNAYNMLYAGMFIFAFANGTLEAVANPLVATVFPNNRTHYLNILHASWPAGLVLGSVLGWVLDDKMNIPWKIQLLIYLIPTVAYGIMFMGQKFPKSEASEKGMKLGEMFKDVGVLGALVACALVALFFGSFLQLFGIGADTAKVAGYVIGGILVIAVGVITRFSMGSVLLFVLFITHALVGAVELGTDGWIQNITGNLFTSSEGKYLFMWTSAIMFGLRFCANFIEKRLGVSPIGLLVICASLACLGLNLASGMTSFTVALLALAVYAIGKTFFWPTMLAVASDRFPRTGAIAISIMGGIGMLSAGMIGGPGLGYAKDRFAGEELNKTAPAIYAEYKAEKPSTFLNIDATSTYGLDGKKLGEAKDAKERTAAQKTVVAADQQGDRRTLKADAFIPLTMAGIYLLILLYFKSIGGYKTVHIEGTTAAKTGSEKVAA